VWKVDLNRLLRGVDSIVLGLAGRNTHETLTSAFTQYGLPAVDEGSKRQRVERCRELITPESVVSIAESMLAVGDLFTSDRNALQEALWWEDPSYPTILRRVRREVAQALDVVSLYQSWDDFMSLLGDLWLADDDPFSAFSLFGGHPTGSLRAQITQHVGRNPGDWSVEHLFKQLGAFNSSDRRFGLFLEGLASPAVLPEEGAQRAFVATVNGRLASAGATLAESGDDGGYPLFRIVSTSAARSRSPKNIVFGSPRKPDIRFASAVDNDIEIVDGADDVLVYDDQVGSEGLRWRDLQSWWMRKRELSDTLEAKNSLYARLLGGVPMDSPPQRELFFAYHREFRSSIPALPALLPEVWLHWDPKTVRQRGPQALLRFRMDFLLLLPHGQRVVLEVDGKQHYSDSRGYADPEIYARGMLADRDLKLAGYEVFRFGAAELGSERAGTVASDFFRSLFSRYGVSVPDNC